MYGPVILCIKNPFSQKCLLSLNPSFVHCNEIALIFKYLKDANALKRKKTIFFHDPSLTPLPYPPRKTPTFSEMSVNPWGEGGGVKPFTDMFVDVFFRPPLEIYCLVELLELTEVMGVYYDIFS